jgi:hypothetical protein
MSTRTEQYSEYDFTNQCEVVFEKKIKFPTYKAGFICVQTCVSAFTELCNTYDEWNHVKAKLKYVPVQDSKLSDDIVSPISYSKTYEEAKADVLDDEVIEFDDVRRVVSRKMKFHKLTDDGVDINSPSEDAERKSKVSRLHAPVQNVNAKFGKPERTRKR